MGMNRNELVFQLAVQFHAASIAASGIPYRSCSGGQKQIDDVAEAKSRMSMSISEAFMFLGMAEREAVIQALPDGSYEWPPE